MKSALLVLFILLFNFILFAQNQKTGLIYIHPKPDASEISVSSSLLFKVSPEEFQSFPDERYDIKINGELSGHIFCESIISGNTLLLKPAKQFKPEEKIFVSIFNNISKETFEYSFTTTSIEKYDFSNLVGYISDDIPAKTNTNYPTVEKAQVINGVAVPSDFPLFEPTIFDPGKVAPGKIFLNNWENTPYIAILNNDGTPYFYQRTESRSRDFKLQPTGYLTRRVRDVDFGYVAMDSSYNIIDSFKCTNGYGTDEHELYMTPDGHYFMIALGYRTVDMSQIVSGGYPNATVVDNHIQEFDENHNLVFEWLCYDYFEITDARHENLRANVIDYVHMNSIAVDYDGNIIISSRHLDEVTKINRQTGDIIWRLGGFNNQFNFTNDQYELAYQHYARPVEGSPGNYIIFDNGNYRSPMFSRGVEFKLNTTDMTAEKVWEFRHEPELYTWWMGNAQRLPNGNTFLNFSGGDLPKAVEVTPAGEVVYEGDFLEYNYCYRAFRFEWESADDKPYLIAESLPDQVALVHNHFGLENLKSFILYKGPSPGNLVPFDTVSQPLTSLTQLQNGQTYFFAVKSVTEGGVISELSNIQEVYVNYVPAGTDFIKNGNFTQGASSWNFGTYETASATGAVNDDGLYHISITLAGESEWNIQLTQDNLPIIKGKKYRFEFDAKADQERTIDMKVEQNGDPYKNYSKTGKVILKPQMRHYSFDFEMTDQSDYKARVSFNCGVYTPDVFIDNVSVYEIPTTWVENNAANLPDFRLYQNYPNPFNPETTISYRLDEQGYVELTVFNFIGEKIETLFSGIASPGIFQHKFNGERLASGIYFYRLEFNGKKSHHQITGKMNLIK